MLDGVNGGTCVWEMAIELTTETGGPVLDGMGELVTLDTFGITLHQPTFETDELGESNLWEDSRVEIEIPATFDLALAGIYKLQITPSSAYPGVGFSTVEFTYNFFEQCHNDGVGQTTVMDGD